MTVQPSAPSPSFDWQSLLFKFEGRTRRSHFWIGWLILLGVGVRRRLDTPARLAAVPGPDLAQHRHRGEAPA